MECVGEGLMRIVEAMNKYGHKVTRIVFDDEAVFVAMEERLAKRNLECTYTPAGKTQQACGARDSGAQVKDEVHEGFPSLCAACDTER